MDITAEAKELPLLQHTDDNTNQTTAIRQYRLTLGKVTVELCSLGASITKLLLPRHDHGDNDNDVDDVVLGYKSPLAMKQSGNPCYLGVVVGRVANRIGNSSFALDNDDNDKKGKDAKKFNLEANDGKNHLHGGINGFGRCIWNGQIITKEVLEGEGKVEYPAVQFDSHSPSGDEGYPAAIHVSATYSLTYSKQQQQENNSNGCGVVLKLVLRGALANPQSGESTPLNLANHSYFNLASHSHSQGILDHVLYMPSECYTPTNEESIPTRQVCKTKNDDDDNDAVMDFQNGKLLSEAIAAFGMSKAGLTKESVDKDLKEKTRCGQDVALSLSKKPYGFDHNYVIKRNPDNSGGSSNEHSDLSVAGILEHAPSKRRLTVKTDAPGVQLYTSNYLDGTCPTPDEAKENATYCQWQGLCLETQSYPDSILTREEREQYQDFAGGACFILKPNGDDYLHTVEYVFDMVQ